MKLVALLAVLGAAAPALAAPARLRQCTALTVPEVTREPFRHARSAAIARTNAPAHVVSDLLDRPRHPARLFVKLSYGSLSKDLEDEDVVAFLDDCDRLRPLGRARTDDDGRVQLPVPSDLDAGLYRVTVVVPGDGSRVTGTVRLLPAGTRLAVLDIDGTLTLDDWELAGDLVRERWTPMLEGTFEAKPYAGIAALTGALAERGWQIVYLTGRPYWLDHVSRKWLEQQACAPGHLVLAPSTGDAYPKQTGVGDFKLARLRALRKLGYHVDHAFGNASTDVYAYERAGIAKARTYIIGKHAGARGTRAVKGGYDEVAREVAGWPAPAQPFAR